MARDPDDDACGPSAERRTFLGAGALLAGTAGAPSARANDSSPTAQPRPLATKVRLSADPAIGPPGRELVTFGLPLAPGAISSATQIRVVLGGAEIPVACRTGLRWHWKDASLRSVTIQCVVDLSQGDVELSVDGAGRNTDADPPMQPVDAGWMDSGHRDPDGRALRCPRVYALHEPSYLAASGLLPPYEPPPRDDPSNIGIWETASRFLDTFPYASTDASAWLFDRPTTLFKLAMQFTDVSRRKRLLRHAAVSKRHYFNYVVRTQLDSSRSSVVPHWWDFKRRATNPGAAFATGTTMYQYCQGAKLALALLGDDTQWDEPMIRTWAADLRRAPAAAGADHAAHEYVHPAPWTERLAGLASLFQLNAWELTGDPEIRKSLDVRVGNLRRHQQAHKPHEIENGWPASNGVFRHSWVGHDADETADYVMQPAQSYPAGAKTLVVTSYLSDFDMPRFVGKGFRFDRNGVVDVTACARNPDGTWTLTLARPLSAPLAPGANVSVASNAGKPPLVEADQAFSPWMSVFIADYLWQQHHLLGTPEVPEMLRRLGHALNDRGFLSTVDANGAFTRDVTNEAERPWRGFNRAGIETYPLYLCSDLAPRNVLYHAGYNDLHTEMIFPLAVARHFEPDPELRKRLDARIRKVYSGLFHERAIFTPMPLRLLNWQHQAMPLRTWKWVERRGAMLA